jgi:ABC-type enterochelin transport system ATPase subunit
MKIKLIQSTKNINSITITDGINILFGPNGCGKSYCLYQIKEFIGESNCFCIDLNKNELSENTLGLNFGKYLISSSGQRIYNNLVSKVDNIYDYIINRNYEDRDSYILIDGLDNNLSLDNILNIRNLLEKISTSDIKHKCFIVVVSNIFEFMYGHRSIWMPNTKYSYFFRKDDYNKYRDVFLNNIKNLD